MSNCNYCNANFINYKCHGCYKWTVGVQVFNSMDRAQRVGVMSGMHPDTKLGAAPAVMSTANLQQATLGARTGGDPLQRGLACWVNLAVASGWWLADWL